ncbi:MAG: UDP-N-acetylglucosamine pyrophosphorylase [Syntrophus sp. (in: bacteria)]|nr:UDP-N-acetylglucosamine pyrophosphorylase [Syntrophus sp. (in: bacteria)]
MNDLKHISTVILAAGKGTRMLSDQAKVLHRLCKEPLLAYSLRLAEAVGPDKIVVIVGHQAETVREAFPAPELVFVEQRPQLGTGHAVLQARDQFAGYTGTILILCGDVPCLKIDTVRSLIERHRREQAAVTVMTTLLDDPGSYGRVITSADGDVLRIVEARDATDQEKQGREINTGIYCADSRFLFEAVAQIKNDNSQQEYYLTDIIEIACKMGCRVRSFIAADAFEVMGVNTLADLEKASEYLSCQR